MANEEQDDADQYTSNTTVRLKFLASFIALCVLLGFMALVGAAALGKASLGAVTSGWFYLVWLVVLSATGWVFGIDLVKEYGKYKKQ